MNGDFGGLGCMNGWMFRLLILNVMFGCLLNGKKVRLILIMMLNRCMGFKGKKYGSLVNKSRFIRLVWVKIFKWKLGICYVEWIELEFSENDRV